ncbi:MAG TPA: hydantoinase/oxoprolinase family protein [Candidatus Binatia bacterium]|jgi:N-methylhydantoinase A|nr:hydantoinase/oxoprolinase family protein [Candidatus Binatia bacterium]
MRIAVDVGGTFTDVIVLDETTNTLRLEKVETTPQDPADGVLQGFHKAKVRLSDIDYFVHGTTLGLNALLTRTGARVAIVTTRGFRDIYELGRTSRDPMYDFKYRKPKTLVPRSLAFEVTERSDFHGNILTPFDHTEAVAVARQIRARDVEAVAVCFLHSYANPAHELAMEEVLRRECPEILLTLSHRLSREYREYERTSTAVIDAYIKPVIRSYLEKLAGDLRRREFTGHFLLTRSGGGAMTVASATEQPVHSVLSGPAGGVIGARSFSQLTGRANLITLDMGGTSLDASLVVDGQITIDHEASFEGLPIAIPAIDIKTIGAGGGSIGWVDDGGHLQVGPQSAGAVPGPACYGKGGRRPTFTDAALIVGCLDPHNFLGGEITLNPVLARQAIQQELAQRLGLSPQQTAAGILRINEAKITGALREVSVERGFHPKDFALLAFGGGGGFVASGVARELGVPTVIVPPGPANFSAFGMLMVNLVHDFAQTYVTELDHADMSVISRIYADLVERGQEALERDGFPGRDRTFLCSAELRYQGQEHTVNLPVLQRSLTARDIESIVSEFNAAHLSQYGHRMDDPVELVTLRVSAVGLLPRPVLPTIAAGTGSAQRARKGSRPVYQPVLDTAVDYTVYDRGRLLCGDRLDGPAIIEEPSSTAVLHRGDSMIVGQYGELVIAIGK